MRVKTSEIENQADGKVLLRITWWDGSQTESTHDDRTLARLEALRLTADGNNECHHPTNAGRIRM